MKQNFTDIAIVIPSLNPDPSFLVLLSEIRKLNDCSILIVNDGSLPDCRGIFEEAEKIHDVTVFHHYRNMGKGRALKTAFNYFLVCSENPVGVVTADADGQHSPEDILKCTEALRAKPDTLILGCRDFDDKTVPWKSKFGNKIACASFFFFGGVHISDTQTGLRGIPAAYLSVLLDIPGERFEYETVMLLETRKNQFRTPIAEIPIKTIYSESNRVTHFRPFIDSIKIYKVILKESYRSFTAFLCSGLLAALIDQGMFFLLYYKILPYWKLEKALLLSLVSARIISLIFNYIVNKNIVFSCKGKLLEKKSLFYFLLLCLWTMVASYYLTKGGIFLFPNANVLGMKIMIDILLFFQNYFVQKHFCFSEKKSS